MFTVVTGPNEKNVNLEFSFCVIVLEIEKKKTELVRKAFCSIQIYLLHKQIND